MFFSDERLHFFNPLTGKYREVIVSCLRLLYQRLYTDLRDYGHSLNRDQILDIFVEASARCALLDDTPDAQTPAKEGRFKSQREQATFVLNRLLDSGWLQRNFDETTLTSSYGFSRVGRLCTQPFVETNSERFRTRHRNTRNTRNSLQAFLRGGEIHDLLDAVEYSERIISDFTDVIAELEERKRDLVREVEAQQLVQEATEQFFEFMEKRFQPDLSVRLSADSVEKYRDEISCLLDDIRQLGDQPKADAERQLRTQLPDMVVAKQSLLLNLLDAIELRLKNASDIMLPALRKALNSFTQRADIIIRQLSYISSQGGDDLVDVCKQLSQLPEDEQAARLGRAADQLSGMSLGYVDAAHNRLHATRTRRVVRSQLGAMADVDTAARRELYVQQVLDQAFSVSNGAVKRYLVDALQKTNSVTSAQLPINNATDFLAVSHAIEVATVNNLSSEFSFQVTDLNRTYSNEFFAQADEFEIRLLEKVDTQTIGLVSDPQDHTEEHYESKDRAINPTQDAKA